MNVSRTPMLSSSNSQRWSACALSLMLGAAVCLAQNALSKEPVKDLIGRPVDLDLSKGVQAPPRDTSKLPATFAEAAQTQAVDSKWGTAPYRPKSRRDLTGIWINQGGIGWTPGIAPGASQ